MSDSEHEGTTESPGGSYQSPVGNDSDLIDGGSVTGLDEPQSFLDIRRHEADTARRLAYFTLLMLAGFFVLQYAVVLFSVYAGM
jgi:hypothetical protein